MALMSTLETFLTGHIAFEVSRVHVARDHLLVPTTWYGFLNLHLTLWAWIVTNQWALVSLITQYSLTVFLTLVLLVLWVIRVAYSSTNMAAVQAELTRHQTPPFRGLFEVLRAGGLDLFFWVVLTAQSERFAHLFLLFQGAEDIAPQFHFAQYCTVSDAVEAFLGA